MGLIESQSNYKAEAQMVEQRDSPGNKTQGVWAAGFLAIFMPAGHHLRKGSRTAN